VLPEWGVRFKYFMPVIQSGQNSRGVHRRPGSCPEGPLIQVFITGCELFAAIVACRREEVKEVVDFNIRKITFQIAID
jgi:hypothetical protein